MHTSIDHRHHHHDATRVAPEENHSIAGVLHAAEGDNIRATVQREKKKGEAQKQCENANRKIFGQRMKRKAINPRGEQR